MPRKTIVLLTALILLCAMPISCARAGVGWFIAGYVLGSSSESPNIQSGINPDLIYQAPNLAQRVADPLTLQQVSKGWDFSTKTGYDAGAGKSVWQLFAQALTDTAGVELLQVRRVISGNNADYANLWFTYTPQTNLIPICVAAPPDTTAISKPK